MPNYGCHGSTGIPIFFQNFIHSKYAYLWTISKSYILLFEHTYCCLIYITEIVRVSNYLYLFIHDMYSSTFTCLLIVSLMEKIFVTVPLCLLVSIRYFVKSITKLIKNPTGIPKLVF